jgi:hypothetical protein
MDWTTVLTGLFSALISGGGLMGLFYMKENKKAKQLANEATASSQWRELFEKSEQKNEKLQTKLDASYKENTSLRDINNGLTKQNAVLKTYKCETIACANRKPPFGSK